jgi:hypothetical protein
MIHTTKTIPKDNKWMQRATQQEEQILIINSRATSHLVTEEMDLPKMGPLNKTIYLPNDTTLKAS